MNNICAKCHWNLSTKYGGIASPEINHKWRADGWADEPKNMLPLLRILQCWRHNNIGHSPWQLRWSGTCWLIVSVIHRSASDLFDQHWRHSFSQCTGTRSAVEALCVMRYTSRQSSLSSIIIIIRRWLIVLSCAGRQLFTPQCFITKRQLFVAFTNRGRQPSTSSCSWCVWQQVVINSLIHSVISFIYLFIQFIQFILFGKSFPP